MLASRPTMGKLLLECFEEAERLGGLVARLRLASLARLSSTEAETAHDDPALVERVQEGLKQIREQFSGNVTKDAAHGSIQIPRLSEDRSTMLRRHLASYLDLMANRNHFMGNVDQTLHRVTEAASTALEVQRVSVWFYDSAYDKISCADLFEQNTSRHTSGTELSASDFVPYFQALRTERTIAAHDANHDPRTCCFSETYLKPLGITSMLDVPIWVGKTMVGVVCHEHVGPRRTWDADEETFAYLMSNFVAMSLERRGL